MTTETLPVDVALYLSADDRLPFHEEPGEDRWPVYLRGRWIEHRALMPLLYTGMLWDLDDRGRLELRAGEHGAVAALRSVEGEREGEPSVLAGSLFLGLPRLRAQHAGDRFPVVDFAAWGLIHQRRGRLARRLTIHDHLQQAGILRAPEGWARTGPKAAWRRFRRRARVGGNYPGQDEPNADELMLDPGAGEKLPELLERVTGRFAAWQSEQPELAAAVLGACTDAIERPTPYKGLRATQVAY